MNDVAACEPLELEVVHFGPIVEAKIALRPLTVFVGPSNTGKSYLAILIYALHRFFSRLRDDRMFVNAMPQPPTNAINRWAEQILADRHTTKSIALPPAITDQLRATFNAQGEPLGAEIERCFGLDATSALIRKGNRQGARIVFRGPDAFEHQLILQAPVAAFAPSPPADTPIQLGIGWEDHQLYRLRGEIEDAVSRLYPSVEGGFLLRRLIGPLLRAALPQLVGPLHVPAFYLPADRTGIMHAHRVVVSSLISRAAQPQLLGTEPVPDLSGVVADFLDQLVKLDHRSHAADDLAKRIEQTILSGLVQIKTSGMGYPLFFYQPDGWKTALPLTNASSMVSELAPVVLYLRHVVQPGQTLIIEEPEAHLHPAMQVELTRQIAALVQAGIRVIITTHSEWVLEELGNIVRRSQLSTAQRQDTPQGEFALRPEQVGAWLFKQKQRPRGSVVAEIKFDEETGLYSTDYEDVSLALYNDSVDIFNRIQNSKIQ